MTKEIFITGQQMIDMGWTLAAQDSATDEFILEINTNPESGTIKARFANCDGCDYLSEYRFDYLDTLKDLYAYHYLPCGIRTGPVFYNNQVEETSEEIHVGSIPEIIGDTSWEELMMYSSLDELNKELTGLSFTDEPEYQ